MSAVPVGPQVVLDLGNQQDFSNLQISAQVGSLILKGIVPFVPRPAPKADAAAGTAVSKSIENLVLNPAGSGGTRFLMVTATFELKDGATLQAMKDHEPEVRDHILSMLGKRTVEELSDIAQRDAIKQAVLEVVQPLFPKGSVLKVFFSQFVIQ